MKKKTVNFMAVMLLVAGCATQKFKFDANQASAYLASHRDRPAHIASGLSTGRLVAGMTEAEVELCWGKPKRKTNDVIGTVLVVGWGYFEPKIVERSATLAVWRDVLVKEAQFTSGVLTAWRETTSGQ